MKQEEKLSNISYDCAIIGGGLAGLCLSVQLAKHGHQVVLFEKNAYPFHKVCGEYISMESWAFLERLGVPLSDWSLPKINRLGVSSTQGFMLNADLKLGGFGVSRYTLDNFLVQLARENGVTIFDNCKVQDIDNQIIKTNKGIFEARIMAGSYGKISPSFMDKQDAPKKNYIGVKYHIETDFPDDRIELHNFKDGYCGISKIDKNQYCLCYLTTADNLKNHGKDIAQMEQSVLMRNPFLKRIFKESTFLFDKPEVISNVTFNAKTTFANDVILLGDAAGAIAPLCGNGMSLAMRASYLLTPLISDFLNEKMLKTQLTKQYDELWRGQFANRIKAGYYIQHVFGNNTMTHLSLKSLDFSPFLLQKLIDLTHGQPF
ncbi:MAG: NAD(P)/FAD-dependent oxidoreductase [Saprospiraceae bacterium]|nr:NAD(P)/FAD-dependent oxidoreductase [Saprospiraceae bacterium]